MAKKSFFRKRTPEEMMDSLDIRAVYSQRNLVARILDLNPSAEGLQLRLPLIPMRFLRGALSGAEASRKCYKHGDLIKLQQPITQAEALACKDIPLAIRKKSFTAELGKFKEEEIFFIGYSWYPVQGNDRRKRVVPFPAISDAVQLFVYAENVANGIEVDDRYIASARVRNEGATILCRVPSRTKRDPRYGVNLVHVPVEGVTARRAVIWSLRSQYEQGKEPKQRTFKDLRYTWETEPETSDIFTFGPHDIVAYTAIAGKLWKVSQNLTPMEMNPFALPAKLGYNYAKKLDNNVMVYDPTLAGKDRLRNLHLAEKAILQSRLIKVLDHDETAYWDWERDGKLKDYDVVK